MANEATVLEAYRRGLITSEQAKAKITEYRGASKSAVETYFTDPLSSIGAGVAERKAGIQQALNPSRAAELNPEIEAARRFQAERGMTGKIGGVVGRDVLGPLAATLAFSNPLSGGALLAAGAAGAAQGYTDPSTAPVSQGQRQMNAATSGVAGTAGQAFGGLAGRYIERGVNALLPARRVANPGEAAARIGDAVRGEASALNSQVGDAYEAANDMGVTFGPQTIRNEITPALQRAYQESGAAVLGNSQARNAIRATQQLAGQGRVPLNQLEEVRKGLVLGGSSANPADARPFQLMRKEYDRAFDGLSPQNLGAKQQAGVEALKGARAMRAQYGRRFEDSDLVSGIVSNLNMTPEELLTGVIGSRSGAGKSGAAQGYDELLNAAGPQAGSVAQDVRAGLINRAYLNAGQGLDKTATELSRVVQQNRSLGERVFTPREVADLSNIDQGRGVVRAIDRFARPALNTGGGVAGLGAGYATMFGQGPNGEQNPYAGGLAMTAGGLLAARAVAGQAARDATAQGMKSIMKSIGQRVSTPGVTSRLAAGAGGGVASIPFQDAFTPRDSFGGLTQPVRRYNRETGKLE